MFQTQLWFNFGKGEHFDEVLFICSVRGTNHIFCFIKPSLDQPSRNIIVLKHSEQGDKAIFFERNVIANIRKLSDMAGQHGHRFYCGNSSLRLRNPFYYLQNFKFKEYYEIQFDRLYMIMRFKDGYIVYFYSQRWWANNASRRYSNGGVPAKQNVNPSSFKKVFGRDNNIFMLYHK